MILALSGLRGQGITLGCPGDTADVLYSLMNRGPCWKLSPVCLKGPRFYPLFLPKETLPKTAGNHPLDSFFQMIFYLHIVCTETNLYIQFSNKNYQLEVMKKKNQNWISSNNINNGQCGSKKISTLRRLFYTSWKQTVHSCLMTIRESDSRARVLWTDSAGGELLVLGVWGWL